MKGHIKKRSDRYYAVIYEGRDVQRHVLPALGRVGIRRLRYQQIEA